MIVRIPHLRWPRFRPWRIAQRLFLIVGLLAACYAAFAFGTRHLYQAYESRVFDRELGLQLTNSLTRSYSRPRSHSQVMLRSLIGKIEIHRLGISAMVKEGVDVRTLGLAVGHIPATALPGEAGNSGFAAHRDTLFRNLKDVRPNDEITLTTLEGTYVYRVVSFKVVNPSEVSVLSSSPDEKILTLVTCYPFYFVGDAPSRFVVRAVQVTSAPSSHQTEEPYKPVRLSSSSEQDN
jgi:sortase A